MKKKRLKLNMKNIKRIIKAIMNQIVHSKIKAIQMKELIILILTSKLRKIQNLKSLESIIEEEVLG